ncbi:MAG: glycosyltransferase [Phototrophicaceae bacterium]
MWLTGLYVGIAWGITLYLLGAWLLIALSLWRKRSPTPPPLTDLPPVTVQLPLYNEQFVVGRLLDAVAKLDYPHEKLCIQVLDDSTDATRQVCAQAVTALQAQGLNIQHIQRPNREGFKAGALAYGMTLSNTPLFAIFDADFIPPPDFLHRTLPYLLADPKLGMVQGRWGHLNPDQNPLTAGQVLAIDAHFLIEQTSRSEHHLPTSFNGTGGVWRRECIEASGGWQSSTLTEDFDLSYRAQLAGWQMLTLPDLVIAGELPAQMSAFRQQQARWARGSTQCLRRLFFPLWRSRMSLFQRIMGTYHLAQYLIYPLVLLFLLLTPPMLLTGRLATLDLRVLALVGLSSPVLYTVSSIRQYGFFKGLWQLLSFPPLIIYGTGITLSNTIAVLMAFSPQHGTFQRTPKYGQHRAGAYTLPFDGMLLAELVLGLYAALGTWLAVELRSPAAPYLALAALAYLGVAITEFLEPFGNSEGVRRTNAPVIERR